MSFAQQRLWFLDQMEGPSATYNIPFAVRLQGRTDVDALRAAVGDVVARHETLRTLYPTVDGRPHQLIIPAGTRGFPLWSPTATAAPSRASERGGVGAVRPRDRTPHPGGAVPPVRGRVRAPGDAASHRQRRMVERPVLGWPVRRLPGPARRAGPEWEPLPVQYADYTLWQHNQLGDVLERQLSHWRQALEGIPQELALPTDRPRSAVASQQGDLVAFGLDSELHSRLDAVARRHGVTLFMVLHAALAALLTRMGAGTDIPIGTVVAGRSDEALDDLVGFFVNTLVLRTDTSGAPSFSELLDRVRETDLAAFDHQDLPFDRLVEELNPVRSLSLHPCSK
ncbi:hypothetical protein GXW82_09185 [Streptacidiphilus sp. 4-A2]|nr:hypothetical protein [Streptacidiphilus sp. 4-A2]